MKGKKGGTKRRFPTRNSYRTHLRNQVKMGKGHNANGDPQPLSNSSMGRDLLAGYNL